MSEQKTSPSKSFKFGVLRRHPVATAVIAILVFAVWTLPLGIAQAWPAFVRDKTIPEWLAERRWPGMTAQLYGWLTIVFFFALAALLVILIRISRRRETSDSERAKEPEAETENQMPAGITAQGTGTVNNSPETINATLNAKFESEKAAMKSQHQGEVLVLKEKMWSLNNQHTKEIQGRERAFDELQRRYDTLIQQNNGLHAELAKRNWLYNIAYEQAERIDRYVILDSIKRGEVRFDDMDGWPFIRFHFYILNESIFDITVELEIGARDSYIVFKNEGLRPDWFLGIPSNRLDIPHYTKGCLTIEQQLTAPQAHVLNRATGQDDAVFHFDRLIITIKGRDVEPQVAEKRLVIDKAITLNNDLLPAGR
jgi:hypothetical protein